MQGNGGAGWRDTIGVFAYKTKHSVPKCIFKNPFLRIIERRERVVGG